MSSTSFNRAAALVPALLAGGAALLAGGPGNGLRPARAAVVAAAETRSDTTVVTMTNELDFEPGEVTIRAGETVLWKNTSVLVHTVTARADSAVNPDHVQLPKGAEPFGSGRLSPDDSFRHTFTVPGTYRYLCIPHETAGMLGTIVVEETTESAREERKP